MDLFCVYYSNYSYKAPLNRIFLYESDEKEAMRRVRELLDSRRYIVKDAEKADYSQITESDVAIGIK